MSYCGLVDAKIRASDKDLPVYVQLQNQEMISEGDLACAMDQSNKIREMQDKISNLRAQVPIFIEFIYNLCISPARPE